MFTFDIAARLAGTDGKRGLGRAGVIHTPHGDIETPAFIPVGTKGTVKALTPELVHDAVGAHAVLANTYHLYLQPGTDVLRAAGGLGKFMNWPGPTFTDSGGFQAFSLQGGMKSRQSKFDRASDAEISNGRGLSEPFREASSADREKSSASDVAVSLAKVDDDGVTFKSIIDGSSHRFTPERSVEIQHDIGADIIFALDECARIDAPYEAQRAAIERTRVWAERCIARHRELGPGSGHPGSAGMEQALFGIIQGGKHEDLRRQSARDIAAVRTGTNDAVGFDGFGIGGTFEKSDMSKAVGWVCDELGRAGAGGKPRHLLGIGEPEDIILGIENGADTFDCVAPTRLGRNGAAYVRHSTNVDGSRRMGSFGRINLLNARFVNDFGPIDQGCECHSCTHYTRAYLAHLFRAKEMLAATLLSVHNLHFLVSLAKEARKAIIEGRFQEFKEGLLS